MRPDRLGGAALAVFIVAFSGIAFGQLSSGKLANQVLREINQQRVLNGVGPLMLNRRLASAAQKHAEDMVKRDYLGHRSPDLRGLTDRVTSAGYPWHAVAENLAAGKLPVNRTVQSWMTSPSHRENMLNPDYSEAGVGYAFFSDDGKRPRYDHYWVVVFAAPSR